MLATNTSQFFKILLDIQILRCVENWKPNISSTDVTNGVSNALISTFVNGTAFWDMIKGWVKEDERTLENDGCEKNSEIKTHFCVYPTIIIAFFVVVFLTLILPLIFIWIFNLFEGESNVRKACPETETVACATATENTPHTENLSTSRKSPLAQKSSEKSDFIALQSFMGNKYGTTYLSCDLADFLKHTSDILIVELDKFLVDKSGRSSTPLQSVISSPRVSRRQIIRTTGRLADSSEADDTEEDPKEQTAWREFQEKIVYKGKFHRTSEIYDDIFTKSSGNSKTLMEFYQNNCTLNFKRSTVANIIVNYSLSILEKAFHKTGSHKGLRFLNFVPIGSSSTGTRCCEPNRFDVLVVLQCTDFSIKHALDRTNLNEIPHGRVYLAAKSSTKHSLLKTRESESYVSSREFMTLASELMDMVLQKLTTEARSVIDRLPFRLQRAATPGIVLSIDTRSVFGFGLSEIRIHMNPALPLLTHGWDPSTLLYAVPLWTYQDLKRKPSTGRSRYTSFLGDTSIPVSDLSWNISYGSLETLYLQALNWKFSLDGERSCHLVCLQTLKALFTATSKRTLLSKGEVASFVIQTVIFYILVESSTRQWTFECLPDRFSDSVHFLRSALKNKRLPNFFVSNPYFLKQFTHLQSVPILSRGRQENLLSDLTPETAEKMLSYMETRLEETGLSCCVRQEYSDDVWEYEYFLQV